MHNAFRDLQQILLSVDKKYLTSGLLALGTNQFAGIVIALASSYFFANYIEKGIYGNYQFTLTILGVMMIFTLRGVEKQIIRSYVRSGLLILVPKTVQFFKYTLPVVAFGLCTSFYFFAKENSDLAISLLITSLFFPLLKSLSLYNAVLLAKEKFKKHATVGIVQNALPALSLIIAILSGASLITLILTYCISNTLTLFFLYSYVVVSENVPLRERTTYSTTELHLSFSQSILEIGKIADNLMVFGLLGTTTFASYMIALLPVRELMRLPQVLRSLLTPRFSKYSYIQVKTKIMEKVAVLFLFFTAITILYIFVAPHIFALLFPLYPESVFYTQLLALTLPLSSSLVMVQMLTVFDKTKELYITNTLFAILKVILLGVMGIYFGIIGIIFARLIASVIRFFTLLFFCLKIDKPS